MVEVLLERRVGSLNNNPFFLGVMRMKLYGAVQIFGGFCAEMLELLLWLVMLMFQDDI